MISLIFDISCSIWYYYGAQNRRFEYRKELIFKIYVDYDDCLCETAKAFTGIAGRMFGKTVPYEDVRFFNLQESFDLSDKQYEELMIEGHREEALLSYEETPMASDTLLGWIGKGYEVSVITGRPKSVYEASREWLDRHGLSQLKLYCLNKYGRDAFIKDSDFSLELEDFYRMSFDYAVEDSPMAFRFFDHLPDLKVMVYDRPWNRDHPFPGDNYIRCHDWGQIRERVRDILT